MEVVKAEPVNTMNQGDLSDDECLYQFTVDLIQTDKILLNVFNVQTGITYKQYINKDDEWYKSNIYIFQGNFSKVRNILSQSLVKESKQLPYLITEKTNELQVKINYEHDMYPFELILTVPQHVSKSGVLEDRINSLEYQVKRLKQKLSQKNERKKKHTQGDEIYNAFGNLIYKGEIQDGKPHGKGIRYCDDSGEILYEGEFKHGLYDGEGILYHYGGGSQCNGQLSSFYHKGSFSKGMKHGKVLQKHLRQHTEQYNISHYRMGKIVGKSYSIKNNKQVAYHDYGEGEQTAISTNTENENIMYDDDGNRV
tara:strand:+ start:108 stop:1037 length:930 start_codon:yes stop_codon:yes gene_type:complete